MLLKVFLLIWMVQLRCLAIIHIRADWISKAGDKHYPKDWVEASLTAHPAAEIPKKPHQKYGVVEKYGPIIRVCLLQPHEGESRQETRCLIKLGLHCQKA
jgi:hypothetical protein